MPRGPTPAFTRRAAELREHVARLGGERVAALLGLTLDDLKPLLAGRVSPSRLGLWRLRRAEPDR